MKNKFVTLLVAVVLAAFAGSAMPGERSQQLNGLLKGKYRFTLNQTCTYTSQGFRDPPVGVVEGGVSSSGEDFIVGVIEYDGEGNLRSTEKGLFQSQGTFFGDPSFPSFTIATYTDDCAGTYRVNPDRSFTSDLGCFTDIITGFAPGARIRLDGLRNEGQITGLGEAFIAWIVDGIVQTQYFTLPDGTQFQQYRVCAQTMQGIRVSR